MVKVVAIGGGKGGTGKSTIAVGLAVLLASKGAKVLLIDADVQSPVDHILLGAERKLIGEIHSFVPKIDLHKCVSCGSCARNCPEHALIWAPGRVPVLIEELCEGCKICLYSCPVGAISEGKRLLGRIYAGEGYGVQLLQAEVEAGVKEHVNVTIEFLRRIKEEFQKYDAVIIDGPPGTGAATLAVIRVADEVLAVTEPTPLGERDLKRFLELTKIVEKRVRVVLNKAGMSRKKPEIKVDFTVPFSPEIVAKYMRGEPATSGTFSHTEVFEKICKDIFLL